MNNKLYKILFIILHIICLILFVTSYINLEGYLEVRMIDGNLSPCTSVSEYILNIIKSIVIYILVYRVITTLVYKRKYSNKIIATLCRSVSIVLCIIVSLYLIFVPADSMPVVSLFNAPISESILKIIGWLILIIPLIMINSVDLLMNNKDVELEKKDLFLLIIIFMFILLITVVFSVNTKNMYFTNTVWQDFHKYTSMYYFFFLILPIVLNDIYLLIRLNERKKV